MSRIAQFLLLIAIIALDGQILPETSENISPEYLKHDTSAMYDEFPSMIHHFHHRRDIYTNELVKRGKLNELGGPLGGQSNGDRKVSYEDFKRILQCPKTEPGIEGSRGSISLLKLLKPTRKTVELMCTWVETNCNGWTDCQERHRQFKANPTSVDSVLDHNAIYVELVRLINSTFYYDWPFQRSRFDSKQQILKNKLKYYFLVTDKILDFNDSVFLIGQETPFMPYNFPFPALSCSPGLTFMDIPNPWPKSIVSELNRYKDYENDNNVYSRYHSTEAEWSTSRLNKAGFYGGALTMARLILFDLANIRPDLIDASFLSYVSPQQIHPWNPESEETVPELSPVDVMSKYNENPMNKTGYIQSILRHHQLHATLYLPMKYKYLIVINGKNNEASADRLAELIAHSGAVILLQISSFEYHFSPRLKPWVRLVTKSSVVTLLTEYSSCYCRFIMSRSASTQPTSLRR